MFDWRLYSCTFSAPARCRIKSSIGFDKKWMTWNYIEGKKVKLKFFIKTEAINFHIFRALNVESGILRGNKIINESD